jgi:hypothetical protein
METILFSFFCDTKIAPQFSQEIRDTLYRKHYGSVNSKITTQSILTEP